MHKCKCKTKARCWKFRIAFEVSNKRVVKYLQWHIWVISMTLNLRNFLSAIFFCLFSFQLLLVTDQCMSRMLCKFVSQLSKKYGSVFTVHFGPKKVVVLAGYKTVKQALVNQAETFGEKDITYSRISISLTQHDTAWCALMNHCWSLSLIIGNTDIFDNFSILAQLFYSC